MSVQTGRAGRQLEEVRRIFGAFLQRRGRRQTQERFFVLEEIYATGDHIDADELYVRLKKRGHRVSRATVYNTLELLMDCDLVVRHQFGKGQAKYERAFSYWQHDHLICMDCNELFEFCDPRIQSIQEMVANIYHFEIKHHSAQHVRPVHTRALPEPARAGWKHPCHAG